MSVIRDFAQVADNHKPRCSLLPGPTPASDSSGPYDDMADFNVPVSTEISTSLSDSIVIDDLNLPSPNGTPDRNTLNTRVVGYNNIMHSHTLRQINSANLRAERLGGTEPKSSMPLTALSRQYESKTVDKGVDADEYMPVMSNDAALDDFLEEDTPSTILSARAAVEEGMRRLSVSTQEAASMATRPPTFRTSTSKSESSSPHPTSLRALGRIATSKTWTGAGEEEEEEQIGNPCNTPELEETTMTKANSVAVSKEVRRSRRSVL